MAEYQARGGDRPRFAVYRQFGGVVLLRKHLVGLQTCIYPHDHGRPSRTLLDHNRVSASPSPCSQRCYCCSIVAIVALVLFLLL